VLAIARGRLLQPGDRVLYFTPEPVLSEYLIDRVGQYRSLDVKQAEIISAGDGAFDAIIASNILEHADDDRKALGELRRVLAHDGELIITVPLVGGWDSTYENPYVATEEERLLHYGERNHVRYYGRDLRDRIAAAGFEVEEHVASGDESIRYGLIRGDRVFVARTTAAS
jgi:SAM-dependent methyltransferase